MERRGAGSKYGEGPAILSQRKITTTLVRGLFMVDITLSPSLLLQTTFTFAPVFYSASRLELLLYFFRPLFVFLWRRSPFMGHPSSI